MGDATTTVSFVKEVTPLCTVTVPSGFVLEACQITGPPPKIVLPNPCSPEFHGQSFARLACHELGHLNGWPWNHPR